MAKFLVVFEDKTDTLSYGTFEAEDFDAALQHACNFSRQYKIRHLQELHAPEEISGTYLCIIQGKDGITVELVDAITMKGAVNSHSDAALGQMTVCYLITKEKKSPPRRTIVTVHAKQGG